MALMKSKDDSFKYHDTKTNNIRTNFILKNVYAFLLKDYYNFDAEMYATNQNEKNVLKCIEKNLTIFRDFYKIEMKNFVETINIMDKSYIESVLLKTANVLFEDGITWCRIIAYFSFVGELGIWCISKNLPISFINDLYESFKHFVDIKLEKWIQDHDGWEGILTVFESEELVKEEISKSDWIKRMLQVTISMLGALAKIGNTVYNYNNII